jgi:hypothetical protein
MNSLRTPLKADPAMGTSDSTEPITSCNQLAPEADLLGVPRYFRGTVLTSRGI